jgi:hypothetical protein
MGDTKNERKRGLKKEKEITKEREDGRKEETKNERK